MKKAEEEAGNPLIGYITDQRVSLAILSEMQPYFFNTVFIKMKSASGLERFFFLFLLELYSYQRRCFLSYWAPLPSCFSPPFQHN